MGTFLVGLDLGQAQDFSALAVVERTERADGSAHYAVRHLRRWPLATPYTQIVEDVSAILDRPPLPGCHLIVDGTGVGRAVVDLFRQSIAKQSQRPRPPAQLVPVTITAGFYAAHNAGFWSVPKKDLAGVLQVLLAQRRFTIAKLAERTALLKELRAFKVKVSPTTGNETFEAWRERDHDDLVFSVALPCWYAERAMRQPGTIRVLRSGMLPRSKGLRMVCCDRSQLEPMELVEPSILVTISNPGDSTKAAPPHALAKMLDHVQLEFLDSHPADHADNWHDLLPEFGQPPSKLIMNRDHGRHLWSALVRKRDVVPEMFVFCDDGGEDGRAISVALAVCDSLGLPRPPTIFRATDPEWRASREGPAPNQHVYEMTRASRAAIAGGISYAPVSMQKGWTPIHLGS